MTELAEAGRVGPKSSSVIVTSAVDAMKSCAATSPGDLTQEEADARLCAISGAPTAGMKSMTSNDAGG